MFTRHGGTVNYDVINTFGAGQVVGSNDSAHPNQCLIEFTTATSAHDAFVHYSLVYRVKD